MRDLGGWKAAVRTGLAALLVALLAGCHQGHKSGILTLHRLSRTPGTRTEKNRRESAAVLKSKMALRRQALSDNPPWWKRPDRQGLAGPAAKTASPEQPKPTPFLVTGRQPEAAVPNRDLLRLAAPANPMNRVGGPQPQPQPDSRPPGTAFETN